MRSSRCSRNIDLGTCRERRPIRSAVEREFTVIGEAARSLARQDADLAASVSHARLIVGFRNQIVHAYSQIDDETVYSIARHDVPVLRSECVALLEQLSDAG